jgi:hypothetical protein
MWCGDYQCGACELNINIYLITLFVFLCSNDASTYSTSPFVTVSSTCVLEKILLIIKWGHNHYLIGYCLSDHMNTGTVNDERPRSSHANVTP